MVLPFFALSRVFRGRLTRASRMCSVASPRPFATNSRYPPRRNRSYGDNGGKPRDFRQRIREPSLPQRAKAPSSGSSKEPLSAYNSKMSQVLLRLERSAYPLAGGNTDNFERTSVLEQLLDLIQEADKLSRHIDGSPINFQNSPREKKAGFLLVGKKLGDLMVRAAKGPHPALGIRVFDEYRKRFTANVFHYNCIIPVVDTARANVLFAEMLDNGVKPDQRTYDRMIKANVVGVRIGVNDVPPSPVLKQCRYLLNHMYSKGVRPDPIACTSIMRSFVIINGIDEMEQLFKDMLHWNGKADTMACHVVMQAYASRRLLDKVTELLLLMRKVGVKVDGHFCSMLRNAFERDGGIGPEARRLLSSLRN